MNAQLRHTRQRASMTMEMRKILAVLIVFIVVLWPVFDQSGTHVLWQWGWLRLTQENLLMAAVMGLRIPALGFACFITLFTNSQTKLVRGLTSLGMPYKAGLTLATALRYIPVFFSIFQSVSEAQRARGLDLSGKVNAAGKKRNIFVRLVGADQYGDDEDRKSVV